MVIGNVNTLFIKIGDIKGSMITLDIFVDKVNLTSEDNSHYIPALHSEVCGELSRFECDENLFKFDQFILGDNVYEKLDFLRMYVGDEFDPGYFKVLSWGAPLWNCTSYLIPFDNKVNLVCLLENSEHGSFVNCAVGFGCYFYVLKTLDDYLKSVYTF